jgi:DNA-binding NtrC family response regulator
MPPGINMPVMDGLTLLARLREQRTEMRTIIVSAYGYMQNLRTATKRGAFDFVTKPADLDDPEIRRLSHQVDRAYAVARTVPGTSQDTAPSMGHFCRGLRNRVALRRSAQWPSRPCLW